MDDFSGTFSALFSPLGLGALGLIVLLWALRRPRR